MRFGVLTSTDLAPAPPPGPLLGPHFCPRPCAAAAPVPRPAAGAAR